jgi:hypothetical protein
VQAACTILARARHALKIGISGRSQTYVRNEQNNDTNL